MTRDSKVSLAAVITSVAGFIAIEAMERMEQRTPACPATVHETYNAAGRPKYADKDQKYNVVYPIGQDRALLAAPSGQNCMFNHS